MLIDLSWKPHLALTMAALSSNSWGSPQTAVLSQDTGSGGANGHLRLVYWCLMGFFPSVGNVPSLQPQPSRKPHRIDQLLGLETSHEINSVVSTSFLPSSLTFPFRRKIANFVKILMKIDLFTKFTHMFSANLDKTHHFRNMVSQKTASLQ